MSIELSKKNAVISLKDVAIYQSNTMILENINLELYQGDFAYLIGKTGAGKSSLLKTLYGEIPIKQGSASVVDFDLKTLNWKNVPLLRRKMGIVFQDFQLLNDRSIESNLAFVLKATGWTDNNKIKDKIAKVLSDVGLSGKGYRMPYELSGGEQQRVDIARSLLNDPKLILADEPTGNLDPETTLNIMNLLIKVAHEYGSAVLMATHDYSIIRNFPGRILKIENNSLREADFLD